MCMYSLFTVFLLPGLLSAFLMICCKLAIEMKAAILCNTSVPLNLNVAYLIVLFLSLGVVQGFLTVLLHDGFF